MTGWNAAPSKAISRNLPADGMQFVYDNRRIVGVQRLAG
jgi:hypothetical protein